MFNPALEHPMEMFSKEHIIALLIITAVILAVFFSRKFFMKYSIADKIFRYTLVVILLVFELIPIYYYKFVGLFSYNALEPYPLCTLMLWITVVTLLSNSSRLARLEYPLAVLGAFLSLVFVSTKAVFPHFKAFAFFITHATFLLAVLYFVFTKKIEKYTIKDFGMSCLLLFGLSCYSLIVSNQHLTYNPAYNDEMFLITPPGGLEFFKEALGQYGYTIAFSAVVVLIMLAVYGITYFCTRHRSADFQKNPVMKDNKILDKLSNLTSFRRFLVIALVYGLGLYNGVMQKIIGSTFLIIVDILFYVLLIAAFVINEVIHNYQNRPVLQVEGNKVIEEDKENISKDNTNINKNNLVKEDLKHQNNLDEKDTKKTKTKK